jgi:iron complex outermembrane recepter protein
MTKTAAPRIVRSSALLTGLMLSTALSIPAYAQVEVVIVTAERKAEDIQTVPIAVSAFSAGDLQAHQIKQFKDLQFAVPNVTVNNGNFGGANFQIRGIGSAAVSTSGDSGVAIVQNDIYLSSPPTATAVYYDLQDLEILRGPQSTLYGRSASGGAITITTKKANVDDYSADLEGTYGNFDSYEARGAVNIPLIPGELGLRLATFYENKGGDIRNIYPSLPIGEGSGIARNIDSRNDYSVRGSLMWEPTSKTRVELMVQYGDSADSRVRPVVQACHRDPSGVLGCLPDRLAFEPVNSNATLGNLVASELTLGGIALVHVAGPNADCSNCSTVVPSDYRSVNTDFTPISRGYDDLVTLHIHQDVSSWLNFDGDFGWNHNMGLSQQSYGSAGEVIDPTRLAIAQGYIAGAFPAFYNQYYASHPGELPISGVGRYNGNIDASGFGLASGNIRDYSNKFQSYDQISGYDTEWTGEARLSTNLPGPLNFLMGLYHIYNQNNAEYFVNSNTLDFAGVAFALNPAVVGVFGPTQYDNNSNYFKLDSSSVYAEGYWDIVPDEWKLTVGGRWSHDIKTFDSRQTLFNAFIPAGLTDQQINGLLAPFNQPTRNLTVDQLTGHVVLNWTPKIDWTDSTHVYASVSHGARPGGFNPPSFTGAFPPTFKSEYVDAYELGMKNQLFDSTVTANLTAWYYDYINYQVSKIVDRTSVNANFDAHMWGLEGELFWAATDALQFNANLGYNGSQIGHDSSLDTRNPAQGAPGATLVKDSNGANCVIFSPTGAVGSAPTPLTPGFGGLLVDGPAQISPTIAEHASYLSGGPTCGPTLQAYLDTHAPGYVQSPGVEVNLHGNHMPNTPEFSFNVGAQYTFDLTSDYNLVPRIDFYWKGRSYAQYFNAPTDRVPSWYTANAQIQLNSTADNWYAKVWVTNLFDGDQVTGSYVTDPSSGLFTNLFVEQPRMYGITIGAHF